MSNQKRTRNEPCRPYRINTFRVGECGTTNEGYIAKIDSYDNAKNIIVEIQDDHKAKVKTTYNNFKKGTIANPFHRSVYGIGYLGIGDYPAYINKKPTPFYVYWVNMLNRCYVEQSLRDHESYIECEVCDEWQCFSSFVLWCKDNYYDIENEKNTLEKDIISKNNKIYSPDTCIFAPERINVLFNKRRKMRGDYPIGVYYSKNDNGFRAQLSIDGTQKYLGVYDTPEEAFGVYKFEKEKYIKEIAEEYKNKIHVKLYDALYKYQVDIDD